MTFLDDKTTVPAGEPNNPISTNVKCHNCSLRAVVGMIGALDNNWKIGGIIPSVAVVSEISVSTTKFV